MSRYSIGPAGKDTSKRLLSEVKNGHLSVDRAHELLYSGTGGGRVRRRGDKNKKRVPVQYEAEDSDDDSGDEEASDEGDIVYYSKDRNARHHAGPVVIKKKKGPKQKKGEELAIHKAYKKLIDDGEGTCPLCCSPLRGCVRVMWYCVLLFVGLMCLLVVLGWLMKLFMTIWPWL